MATSIRPAIPEDVPQILTFIRALAAYEREPDAVTATEADLLARRIRAQPLLISASSQTTTGNPQVLLSIFSATPPGWGGQDCIWKTPFVHPEFRGLGIGKALLERVAAIAVEKDCPRMQWEVLDWNTPAIYFYRAMGAEYMDAWRNVSVTGAALNRLAGDSSDLGANAVAPDQKAEAAH